MSAVNLRVRPLVLIIRDGWGQNPYPELSPYDATVKADTPVDDRLRQSCPMCLIATSGEDVGLPDGTMGNSEVGHQNIGAGRIVNQESMRLTAAIRDESFFANETLLRAVRQCKGNGGTLHLLGLVSDAGVHSLLGHLYGLLELAKREGLTQVVLHAFTDGRDTPPRSGMGFLEQIEARMGELGVGRVVSIVGRFYAMDRDHRWERVEKAYKVICEGQGQTFSTATGAMAASYEQDVTDEFVEPAVIDPDGHGPVTVKDGDAVVFYNFRGDRPRELTRAFVDDGFEGFDRGRKLDLFYVCMTEYDKTIEAPVAFRKPPKMENIAGAYLSAQGLTQFRCAETEKYPHVTFFFNDYTEEPFEGEQRQICPSPKVRTYDLKPEMSACEVCETVLRKLDEGLIDFYVVNFANPDMVGHTGVMEAAQKAAEVVDECVGRILDKLAQKGGSAIVTADHGNLEKMYDPEADSPMTAHTTYTVPLFVVDEKYGQCKLRDDGRLADVIPTAFEIIGLAKPAEMTGTSLIIP